MKHVLTCFLLILTGCATQIKVVDSNKFSATVPPIGDISEVEIGTSLVSRETGYKYKALKLLKDGKIRIGYFIKEVKEGDIFINDSYTSTYDLYSALTTTSTGLGFGIAIPKSGGKAATFNKTPTGTNFNKYDLDLEYVQITTPVPKKEYLKQDFIYNGKVGSAIKFTYREYANDLARPAFTQDLQYDLTESSIIGFKGLRIEVLSATNIKISYKFLSYYTE